MSKIEGLLDDLLISVCDMDAEQDNDEDAVGPPAITDVKNSVLSVNAAEFSRAEREYEKETGAKMRPAIVSGIVTGDAPVSYWTMFSLKNSTRSLCERTEVRGFWNPQLMQRTHGALCDKGATDWHFFPA